ncbi:MAG: hypothetical protein HY681_13080 [Chloroflexi bacterium]|nr:hypothetical protein [Chloroflexota bacterium]
MVDELVVREQLTDGMIRAGETLTRALDQAKVPINGAFWLYSSESERWTLVLVSEQVGESGPRKVYGDIQRVLLSLTTKKKLRLSDITVMEDTAPLPSALRNVLEPAMNVRGMRLGGNVVNGQYVEDAYLYFFR